MNERDGTGSGWIPVIERTPEEGQPCVVFVPDRSEFTRERWGPDHGCGSMSFAVFVVGAWRLVGRPPGESPSHWMPLPEPPK